MRPKAPLDPGTKAEVDERAAMRQAATFMLVIGAYWREEGVAVDAYVRAVTNIITARMCVRVCWRELCEF